MDKIKFSLNSDAINASNPYLGARVNAFEIGTQGTMILLSPKSPSWKLGVHLYDNSDPRSPYEKNVGQEFYLLCPKEGRKETLLIFDNRDLGLDIGASESTHPYSRKLQIAIFLKYLPGGRSLYLSYKIDDQVREFDIPCPYPVGAFRITLEAVNDMAEMDIELQSITGFQGNLTPFRVGNVLFRYGNAVDRAVLEKVSHLVLPVSAEGFSTERILEVNRLFGLEAPRPAPGGSLQTFNKKYNGRPMSVSYARSVFEQSSNLRTIEEICNSLAVLLNREAGSSNVSLPLLGTGTGRLPVNTIGDLFIDKFRPLFQFHRLFVSIMDREVFNVLHAHYENDATPAPFAFFKARPVIIAELENEFNTFIDDEDFGLNILHDVLELTLRQVNRLNLSALAKMEFLRKLEIIDSKIVDLDFSGLFANLRSLSIVDCGIQDIREIARCRKIDFLNLSNNVIGDISQLKHLEALSVLIVKGNNLQSLEGMEACKNLDYLDVSSNAIRDAAPLSGLKNLRNLNLSRNSISELSFIRKLTGLKILDVSHNRISDAKAVLKSPSLEQLIISNNPLEREYDIKISDFENHLVTVKNYLLRQEEKRKIQLEFPVKVLLLGNHASGKSTLLHYFQEKTLVSDLDSTHIIKIEPYPKTYERFPRAIFFDFGGQDYYHGIYRAFLSGGAVYMLLWQTGTNDNKQQLDSRGMMTQNFKLDYWFHQKKYLEQEKFYSDDPILLVQTRADVDQKLLPECVSGNDQISNEFHISLKTARSGGKSAPKNISLKNYHALEYLQESMHELLAERQSVRKEPRWYVDFIDLVLNRAKQSDFHAVEVQELLSYYNRDDEDIEAYLKDDLDQLHRQGLIIYYKDAIPSKAWLNPVALVDYIHSVVLNKELLGKDFNGKMSIQKLADIDGDVVELLIQQKVLFYHSQDNSYIVPNYLPLAQVADSDFDLLTFGLGKPLFVLKFKHFIPFGLINQIICAFGVLPDRKRFWRDQLLFTLEGTVKILIKIDFENLEIKVFAHFFDKAVEKNKDEYIKYLFYGLLINYWDMQMFSFAEFKQYHANSLKLEDFDIGDEMYSKINHAINIYDNHNCQPLDLYISMDEEYFIAYQTLCGLEDEVQVSCFELDAQRNFKEKLVPKPVFQFQPFTLRALKRPKKAVISYSKKDIALVDKFRQYLVPLSDDGLIENPWYCSELIAGSDWDDTIQQKFNEAEIIFFMISENLMSTSYVKDHEIKNAIDRWNRDQSIRIVPIVLVSYHWARKGSYNLADFTALPYTAYPITSFPDQHMAWNYVSEAIRIMLENDLYPGSEPFRLSQEMEQFFKRVMDYRAGKLPAED